MGHLASETECRGTPGERYFKIHKSGTLGGVGDWGSWDVCVAVCFVDEGSDKRTHFCGWSKFRTARGGCLHPVSPSSDFIGLCSDHDRN